MIRLFSPLPRPDARARLVCLPHAGGGATAFADWAELLDPDVELLAAALPGRDALIEEPPIDDLAILLDSLCTAIEPLADRPVMLFGHSMGALVAYELAHELRRRGGAQPAYLFVSAYHAPHLAEEFRSRTCELDDAGFLAAMSVWGSDEVPEELLPALRADVAVCERYAYRPRPPLAAPISAFGGISDAQITRASLEAWSLHTSGAFRLRMLPGAHFFHRESATRLLRALNKDLSDGLGT